MPTPEPERINYTLTPGETIRERWYPKNDRYIWGEFAVLAIETGGYRDLSAINPLNGARITLLDAFVNPETKLTDALRKLCDLMDAVPQWDATVYTPEAQAEIDGRRAKIRKQFAIPEPQPHCPVGSCQIETHHHCVSMTCPGHLKDTETCPA